MARKRKRSRRRNSSRGYSKILLGIFIGITLITAIGAAGIEVPLDSSNQRSPRTESTGTNTSDPLYFEAEDAAFLNRIFRERNHEVAYCGYVIEVENTWLKPWLADSYDSSPHSVEFTTANCEGDAGALLSTIHTHPSGNPSLSEQDRETLTLHRMNTMCIQSGPIETEEGTQIEELLCYKQEHLNGKSQILEIPVVVGDEPNTGDTWE